MWHRRIATGKLNLLVGPSGRGKSCVALDIAARLSDGRPWPDDPAATEQQPGGVLLVADVANLADTVIPRLKAAGANLDRIHALTSLSRGQDEGQEERARNHFSKTPSGPRQTVPDLSPRPRPTRRVHDLSRLEAAVQHTPDCRLVLLDPVFRTAVDTVAVGQTGNTVNLAPLCRLAARLQVALLAVAPLRDAISAHAVREAVDRLPASSIAATIWGAADDRAEPGRRLLMPLKSTLTHDTPPLAYEIVADPEHPEIPRVDWEDEPADISLDDAFDRRDARAQQRDAVHWLETALAAGPVPAAALLEQANANGIPTRAIRTAMTTIGGIRFRKGFGRGGNWYWALNQQQADAEQSRPPTNEDYLAELDENHRELVESLEADLFPNTRFT